MKNAYAVIMAGGGGTRLWPLSRKEKPKPFLQLVDNKKSMFQISVERLSPLFPLERILVVAGESLIPLLREHAPDLPEENFITEPYGRDTAPAVGLGAIHVRDRDPSAVMAILTADHYIEDLDTFRKVLEVACTVSSEEDSITTLSINPSYASTGFGYIKCGTLEKTVDTVEVYELSEFVEKPDQTRAEELLRDGRYSWNSGMFVWPVQRVMTEFKQHSPILYSQLEEIASSIGQENYQSAMKTVWDSIKPISVDYALMEHISDNVKVIPVEMGWTDIGNFGTLYDILASSNQSDENVSIGHEILPIDVKGSLVYSKRLVAIVGVKDLVVVDTDDILLICARERVQDVKKLVGELKEKGREEYL